MKISDEPDGGAGAPAELCQSFVSAIEDIAGGNGEIGLGSKAGDPLFLDSGLGRELDGGGEAGGPFADPVGPRPERGKDASGHD